MNKKHRNETEKQYKAEDRWFLNVETKISEYSISLTWLITLVVNLLNHENHSDDQAVIEFFYSENVEK